MGQTIIVKPNQSMMDMVIQATGSMESGMQFCEDNGVAISDIPEVGEEYMVSGAALAFGDPEVTQYLLQNGIVIGTLNNIPGAALNYSVALYPVMEWFVNPASIVMTPDVLGYWDIFLSTPDSLSFISTYGLAAAPYPSNPNPMNYENEGDIVIGNSPIPINQQAAPVMPDKLISYHIPWVAGSSFMIVCSDFFGSGGSFATATFKDTNGNEAFTAPLAVLKPDAQEVVESLLPAMLVELVSSDDTSATLRLTISHAAATVPIISAINLFFIDEASGGTPDPDDSANANKTIVVVGSGVHQFGVIAQYVDSDGVNTVGYSGIEMCIEVG